MWKHIIGIILMVLQPTVATLEHLDAAVDENDIFVKDGILIQPGETMFEVKAIYELLICISKPERPGFSQWFATMERALADDTIRDFIPENVIRLYKSKLNRIYQSITLSNLIEKTPLILPSGNRRRRTRWKVINNTRLSRSTHNRSSLLGLKSFDWDSIETSLREGNETYQNKTYQNIINKVPMNIIDKFHPVLW